MNYESFWSAGAAVGSATWFVTFATIAFATTRSAVIKELRPDRRFAVYFAVFLTNLDVVSSTLTSLRRLVPPEAVRFATGGAVFAEIIASLLLWQVIFTIIARNTSRFARLRQALILGVLFLLISSISWQGLFGSNQRAVETVVVQLGLAFVIPMTAIWVLINDGEVASQTPADRKGRNVNADLARVVRHATRGRPRSSRA